MVVWEHLCRIYRTTLTQQHDLLRIKGSSDVYGEDKPCKCLPSQGELLELTPGGMLAAPQRQADLWFERGTVVNEDDVVAVKKTRIRNGSREAVTTELSVEASDGVVTLYVEDPVGLEGGDEITLSDGTNVQRLLVKSIDENTVTVLDPLKYTFAAGSDITVETYYKIQTVRVPGAIGPVIQTTAVVTINTERGT